MGLFSFFSKSPQKSEEKGDRFYEAKEYGLAKLEYETALGLVNKKQPDDEELKNSIITKLTDSKEALARQHLKNGDNLIEADVVDEAVNLFLIAHSLTEDPELKATLQKRFDSNEVDIQKEAVITESAEQLKTVSEDDDLEHNFEVLCATLPEETANKYNSYGDNFKEGYIALSKADFLNAAEKLQLAMTDNPVSDSLIPVELATALTHLNQTEKAVELLSDHISDNPTSVNGISLLCDLFCDLELFEKAHEVIDQSPSEINESVGGLLLKGRIYFLEKNYSMAETKYRESLDLIGWNDEVARELAITLEASGKKEEALNLYADLLNKCSGCGQRPNPYDQKSFADLSFEMNDLSDKTLKLYLDLANDYPVFRSDCFNKASLIYQKNGNDEEYRHFQQLAEATG